MNFELDEIGLFNIVADIKDGEGVRVLNKYLKDLVISFVKKSKKHTENVGYPPFVYRERQLHTIMAPAINELSDAFLMESLVNRQWSTLGKKDEYDSHGWVDYWCLKKKFNYYIELKHGFISYRTGKICKYVKSEWDIAINQLDVIQQEINTQKDYTRGIFKVIFQVLPIYETVNDKHNADVDIERIYKIQSEFMSEISERQSANWSCVCKFDKKWVRNCEFVDGIQKFPAILFLVNVSEIVK